MESIWEKLLLVAIAVGTWYNSRKLEAVKKEFSERTNARKFLFEKEMEFYQIFFKAITDLRNPLVASTAAVRRMPEEQTALDWQQQNWSEFSKAFNQLHIASMSYRPFYPEDIFAEVDTFLNTCWRRHLKHGDMISDMIEERRDSPEIARNREVRELSKQILEMTDRVIRLMRSRIDSFRGNSAEHPGTLNSILKRAGVRR